MEEKLTGHLCNAPLNLGDYELNRVIPRLMKENNFVFNVLFGIMYKNRIMVGHFWMV